MIYAFQYRMIGSANDGPTPSHVMKFQIQTASLAVSKPEVAINSASIVELATVSFFELFQLTAPPLRQNTKPDWDIESSLPVWKLELV